MMPTSFKLRLPEALHENVKAAAKQSGKSINAEITARLQTTFSESGESDHLDRLLDDPDLRAMAYTMLTTFDRAGRMLAEKPELIAGSKWMLDPACYAGACRAVAAVLIWASGCSSSNS
jgi:Arc-like DNA binding domain